MAAENFHITLKFLGGVDDARIGAFTDALRAAVDGEHAFDLEIVGLGAFPSATRPRVLWAGVAAGLELLTAIAARVDHAMATQGFALEERPFSPHVTLGRVREPRRAPALSEALTAGATGRFGRVAIDSIALMRSDLSPRGARYAELARMPLMR